MYSLSEDNQLSDTKYQKISASPFDQENTLSAHCSELKVKANRMFVLLKRLFLTKDIATWALLHKTYVRPLVEVSKDPHGRDAPTLCNGPKEGASTKR